MEKPNLLERLGKGGMSVAWAVRWSPQDRDGAPAILKHHLLLQGTGNSGGSGMMFVVCQWHPGFFRAGLQGQAPNSTRGFCTLNFCFLPKRRY